MYVYMYVYYSGQLMAVGQLNGSRVNATTVLISWKAPFSLKGVRIIYYAVIILFMATGNTTVIDVPDPYTMVEYNIDHLNPGTNLIITVVPNNNVGSGQPDFVSFVLPAHSG